MRGWAARQVSDGIWAKGDRNPRDFEAPDVSCGRAASLGCFETIFA
jgi:hypothetical protein